MQPQYIALPDTTPKIIGLNTNSENFQVRIRVSASVTVEVSVDNPPDSSPLDGNPATNPNAVVWTAVVPDAAGYVNLDAGPLASATGLAPGPWRAVRFTAATTGSATILQNGIK